MWLYGLPLKMKFPKSGLYISALPPFGLGVFAGVLSAIMGVGGGFILVPAMLYILRMRAGAVVGTSLFQIIITTAITTILQAGRNQTVDIVLSTILLLGGVVGAQIGARFAGRFRAEELRAALGLIVLALLATIGWFKYAAFLGGNWNAFRRNRTNLVGNIILRAIRKNKNQRK